MLSLKLLQKKVDYLDGKISLSSEEIKKLNEELELLKKIEHHSGVLGLGSMSGGQNLHSAYNSRFIRVRYATVVDLIWLKIQEKKVELTRLAEECFYRNTNLNKNKDVCACRLEIGYLKEKLLNKVEKGATLSKKDKKMVEYLKGSYKRKLLSSLYSSYYFLLKNWK